MGEIAVNPVFNVHKKYRDMNLVNPYMFNKSLSSNLVAYYGFNSNLIDSINGHNGTVVGSVSYDTTAQKIGSGALKLSTGYASIPQTTDFDFSNGVSDIPFSFSFWFRRWDGAKRCAMSKSDGTTDGTQWTLFTSGIAGLELYLYTTPTDYIKKMPVMSTLNNVWYHGVITYDGTGVNGVKIYIDSVLKSLTDGSSGIYTVMPVKSQIAKIGDDYTNSYTSSQGLDDLHVWKNRVLTASEVTQLYNGGSGLSYPF